MYDDGATMEVPLSQRNLQRHINRGEQRIDTEQRRDRAEELMDVDERPASVRVVSPSFLTWFSTDADDWRGTPNVTPTTPEPQEDYREEDAEMEREGGDTDDAYSRIHEPLKRYQDKDGGETRNKRRRMVSPTASQLYYNNILSITETQQTIVEYTSPASLTPVLYFMGYTPFAIKWVMCMFVLHTLQTAVSTFGPDTKSFRVKSWITPLHHSLMDTYIWNQSMITLMLLYPEWFGDSAYELACFFTVAQQQFYLAVSLKAHILRNEDKIHPSRLPDVQCRLIDIFLMYALSDVFFISAKVLGLRFLLYIGLVIFNVLPLPLVMAHSTRVEAAIAVSEKIIPSNGKTKAVELEKKKDK